MTVTTQVLGNHTAAIEYTNGDTNADIMAAIHDWLINHGWTTEDTDFWVDAGSYTRRTYSALNSDGVTKKYINIAVSLISTNKEMYIYTGTDYVPSSHTLSNTAWPSDDGTYGPLRLDPNGGVLYLSAHERWCIAHSQNNTKDPGSYYGSAFIGCLETKPTTPGDDNTAVPPQHWANGAMLAGTLGASSWQQVIGITYSNGIGNGGTGTNSPAQYSQISTVFGAWGRSTKSQSNFLKTGVVNPLTQNYEAVDMTVIHDFEHASGSYVKGKIFGLKAVTGGIGQLGDTLKVAVDANFFCDPNGTLTDHFLLTNTFNNTRHAIPL